MPSSNPLFGTTAGGEGKAGTALPGQRHPSRLPKRCELWRYTVFIYSLSLASMIFTVKCLRRAGERVPIKDVESLPGFRGDLRMHIRTYPGQEPVRVASLMDVGNAGTGAILLPELFEPVLVDMAPLALRLRGIERLKDGARVVAVVQEWLCLQETR